MRLGDLDALSKKMFYVEEKQGGYGWVVALEDITKAPTIDPEELRPKGEWQEKLVHDPDFGDICFDQCSVCGDLQYTQSNYCPNCGAKMKGENE